MEKNITQREFNSLVRFIQSGKSIPKIHAWSKTICLKPQALSKYSGVLLTGPDLYTCRHHTALWVWESDDYKGLVLITMISYGIVILSQASTGGIRRRRTGSRHWWACRNEGNRSSVLLEEKKHAHHYDKRQSEDHEKLWNNDTESLRRERCW